MTDKPKTYDENGCLIKPEVETDNLPIAESTGEVDQRIYNKPPEQKRHKPTHDRKRQVFLLAACGTDTKIIAEVIGVSKHNLFKHYRLELTTGQAKVTMRIADKVIEQAENGCERSQKLYLSTIAGWTPKVEIDQRTVIATIDGDKKSNDEPYENPQEASRAYKELINNL